MEPQAERCLPGDGQPGSLEAITTRQGIPDDLASQQALQQLIEGRSLKLEQKIIRKRWLLRLGGDLGEVTTADNRGNHSLGWGDFRLTRQPPIDRLKTTGFGRRLSLPADAPIL